MIINLSMVSVADKLIRH